MFLVSILFKICLSVNLLCICSRDPSTLIMITANLCIFMYWAFVFLCAHQGIELQVQTPASRLAAVRVIDGLNFEVIIGGPGPTRIWYVEFKLWIQTATYAAEINEITDIISLSYNL